MTLLLITPTRHRPHLWPLLEECIKRQTFQDFHWRVVQDSDVQYPYSMGQEVIRRDTSKDYMHSICHNYLAALAPFGLSYLQNYRSGYDYTKDRIAIVEDDDYLAPRYLEIINGLLDRASLVGVAPSAYYHLRSNAYSVRPFYGWCSLSCTAMRGDLLPLFSGLLNENNPLHQDRLLWRLHSGSKLVEANWRDGRPLNIGFKDGSGVGIGHYLSEPVDNGSVLQAWTNDEGRKWCNAA